MGTVAAERRPVKSLLELRRESVVVQQWDLSCGAAALATILNYQYGDRVSEKEVTAGLIRREEYLSNPELVRNRQGFSLLDLKRYVDRRGYEGIAYGRLNLDRVVELAPIIVPVNLSGFNHFVVLRGRQGDWVMLADPAFGNRTMRIEKFEKSWIDSPEFGRVGFVVAPPAGIKAANRLTTRPTDFTFPPGSVLRGVLSRSSR
jgi:uncharacterized protein